MLNPNITSELFEKLNALLFNFGKLIFDKTSVIFLTIFMTFYGCKFAWDMSYKILFKHKLEVEDIIKPLLIVSCVTAVMSASGYVEEWLVRPFYNLAVGLTTITAALTGELIGNPTIVDMLNLVDQRLNQVVFQPLNSIEVGMKIYLYIGIYILMGLYVFVWFLFVALILESIFRFMTFYAISPLIIVSLLFSQTRPIAMAGFRSLLHGILSMFMAGVAMGLTIVIIGDDTTLFFTNGHMDNDWVFGHQYFTLVMIALVSISFHLKAPKIAANLSNLDDGAGAAAAVAGLGSMAVMTGKTALGRMGGKLAGRSARGAGRGASSLGRYGYDKFKNGKGAASLIEHMTGRVS